MNKKLASMKKEIQKHIAFGSELEEARQIMEANGFKCQLMERSSFAEREEDDHPLPIHLDIDFLYCDKERASGLFCTRRWQIAIVQKNMRVSDVFVAITRTCP